MDSPYMHWAKTFQAARYPLAISGIKGLSLAELGATLEDLELDGRVGYGLAELHAAIASKTGVTADRVVLATGTSGANHLVFSALVGDGDEVALEDPVYEPIEMLARHLGAVIRHFPRRRENGFRIDPADVAAVMTAKTRLVVLSNLHNPSAVGTDEVTLKAIGAIAEKARARVVVDEAYIDAAFGDGPPSAATLGDVFVTTSSLTKVFGLGGLRSGWIIADPEVAHRLWQLKNLFGVNEVHPGSRLALRAFARQDEILARAKRIVAANRAAWLAFVARRADLELAPSTYGTTSFPRLLSGSADALCDLLRERYETSLVPGRFFGMADHVRIGLGGDPENFAEGLARLGAAMDELKRAA
jgi:aspartate/methionine/tyrosine aminotransferase